MKTSKRSLYRLSLVAVAFLSIVSLGVLISGQEAATQKMGLIDDWSYHHVVFSNPGTAAEALRNGTTEKWNRIMNDPRYEMQQMRRSLTQRALTAAPDYAARVAILSAASAEAVLIGKAPNRKVTVKKDWSIDIAGGPASVTGTVGSTLNSSTLSTSSTLAIDAVTFHAASPTDETVTFTINAPTNSTHPASGSYIQFLTLNGGSNTVQYIFENQSTLPNGTIAANTCQIRAYYHIGSSGDSASEIASHLYSAMTVAGAGTSSTYECNTGSGAVPTVSGATISNSASFSMTATTGGTTGFSGTASQSGTTNLTSFVYTAGTWGATSGTSNPPTFAFLSGASTYLSQTQIATNIVTAMNANTTFSGDLTATANTPAAGDVTVTDLTSGTGGNGAYTLTAGSFSAFTGGGSLSGGAGFSTLGAGQYPATMAGSGNCASTSNPDFAVYNTGAAGASGQASIIAFDNLYSGCTAPVPSVYWAYNTGGTILTSVAMAVEGNQLAFVHSSASGSSLVLLHWIAGEGASAGSGSAADSPATPANTYTSSSSWVTCRSGATSCQLNLPFSGTAANVTRSAPYYDHLNDIIYVGDDKGVLHKFTGVFRGTPTQVITGGWPITVHASTILTAPVNDGNTFNVFVGDSSGQLSYVRDTGSTRGTCGSGSPPCLGSTTQTLTGPIADGPLVDPSQGTVFAFSGGVNANPLSYEVLQASESLTLLSSITFSGRSGQTYTSNARIGAFDNNYYSSPSSGHLYVCAPTTANFYNGAALYSIGFTSAGVMNTSVASGPLTMVSGSPASGTTADDCSPLTEFYNGTTDYLFLGVAINGNLTGCTGSATVGCLYNFKITSSFPSDSVAGLTETGNTSGIVVDNALSSPAGTSQIYFMPLSSQACSGTATTGNATGGCATQASQSAP